MCFGLLKAFDCAPYHLCLSIIFIYDTSSVRERLSFLSSNSEGEENGCIQLHSAGMEETRG